MTIYTLHCDVCEQFQPAIIILDPPYYICSVHEQAKFDAALGYDRGDMSCDTDYLYRDFRSTATLPKIQKAPRE